jgi:hypothetical protein
MPINDDDLLAAVTGGVDDATPQASTPEPADEQDDEIVDSAADDSAAAHDETGSSADDKSDEPASDDSSTDEGSDSDDESAELDADGKPVVKDDPATAEIDPSTGKPFTPEQIAAKKQKEDFAKAQIEDPVNAPIPKYLKETTQKRMVKLVEIAKDLTVKHESAQRDRNEIIGMITDTGANAVQYTSALAYLKMVNSGDPTQIRQAIAVMQNELTALSRMAGVPVPGVDLLGNHPDLKAAVDAKQITPEIAHELAASREQRSVQAQQVQTSQLTQQQQQAEHNAGVRALNEIGKELAARDPNYRTKAVAVLKGIEAQMKQQPPSQWAQTFLVAYTTFKPPAAPAAVRKTPVVPKNQPLRGNNPSGGQQSTPKNLAEAIDFGIAAGTRRAVR